MIGTQYTTHTNTHTTDIQHMIGTKYTTHTQNIHTQQTYNT